MDPEAIKTCALCANKLLPGGRSDEHVILQAIGGRLTTPDFVCKPCNDKAGHAWDTVLASQLQGLSVFFNVSRENGPAPHMKVETTTGEQYYVRPGDAPRDTHPRISEMPVDGGIQLSVQVRDMAEAKRILTGFKKKYKGIDVDGLLAAAQPTTHYPTGLMKMELGVGGPLAGRSIVKSAVAFAHSSGLSANRCEKAMAYLRGDDTDPPFGFYMERDLVIGRPEETPLHCVAISGISETKLLLGYVEYFGFHRQVVCLSEQYDGPDISHCHAIDPRSAMRLNLSVSLAFTAQDLRDIYDYKRVPDGGYESALAKILRPELNRRRLAERDRAIADAADYAFANCGAKPGDLITPELGRKIASLFTQRLASYIAHVVARPPSPPGVAEQ